MTLTQLLLVMLLQMAMLFAIGYYGFRIWRSSKSVALFPPWKPALPYLPRLFRRSGKREAERDQMMPVPEPQRSRQLRPASEGGGDMSGAERLLRQGFYFEVEAHLEQAFELYVRSKISLETYRRMVVAERKAAGAMLSTLQSDHDNGPWQSSHQDGGLEDVEAALEAIDWCLAWSDNEARRSAEGAVDQSAQPPEPAVEAS